MHHHLRPVILTLLIPVLTAMTGPGPGTWSNAGNLVTPRENHQATLLLDGRVLVTGGKGGAGPYNDLDTAEIFQAPSSWSAAPSMATKRAFHTQTTLPNGKVLVTGGMITIPDPTVGSLTVFLSTAELYDPSTNTWSPAASMNQARASHTATLLEDGRVLVAGGFASSFLTSAETYDPATDTWTGLPQMAFGRGWHTATKLQSGKVLVAGGSFFLIAELFDPATNSWSPTGAMLIFRAEARATILDDGRVLLVAGAAFPPEIYSPVTGTWSTTNPMPLRDWPSVNLLNDGRVLVAGGGPSFVPNVFVFDSSSGQWSADANLLFPRYKHASVRLADGRILIAGGIVTTAELYTPAAPDTTPPQITAPTSLVAEQTSPAGATVAISASAVDDTDGSVPVTNDAPLVFPPGLTTVHFTASDAAGNVARAATDVYVVDTTPPTIWSLSATPSDLWPPNGQYVPVTLSALASDIADLNPLTKIVSISSDETTIGGNPSWVITGDLSAQLRAEKNKNGSVRTYALVVRCTDASGNFSDMTVLVKVQKL